tara:strand:+ start:407 stop:568 length:162 start_codon:yes stop_codon:yes gene_type:complete
MNRDEIDTLIRCYFNARILDGQDYEDNHSIVVSILKNHPEYANYYLTPEEQEE